MKREDIKRILTSSYKDLSPEEGRLVKRIIFTVLGIVSFGLALSSLSFLSAGRKNADSILLSGSMFNFVFSVFACFTFFHLVYKKRIIYILRIAAFLLFCLWLFYLGFIYGSYIFKTAGLVIFLGWSISFIRNIFYSARDVLTGKDEAQLEEKPKNN